MAQFANGSAGSVSEGHEVDASPFNAALKPRILLMGPRRSGKTSIQRVVFYKMSPHETLFQDSTSGLDIKFVANNSFVQFQIWDFPGDFDFRSEPVYGGQVIDEQMIFGAVGALVLVIDAQDEPYQEAVSSLVETIRRAVAINPNLFFEVFIHKVDGDLFLSDDEKIECQRDIQQHITEELEDANLPDVNLSYHLTSIYDHSIFEAFSTVVQNLIPQIHALENLLNCLISNCNMEKSFLFDVVSRIYIATDSNPVEMQAYELCSDMIDVVIDVSCIYGVKSGVEGEGDGVAFDSESSSVIRLDNGMVLYLHEVSGYLALVSWLKADNFKKKGLIDYNIQVFKEALSKVFQGGDPKIDSAPQPLMLEEEGSEAKGSLCLAGNTFKRCAIDTLWYVSGETTRYQLHRRPVESGDKEKCLDREKCNTDLSALTLNDCRKCCAKVWNILGDADTGHVLTEGEGNKSCLKRDGVTATLVPCSDSYTPLALNFATKDDIKTMTSPSARFITAAADGDKKSVETYIKEDGNVNVRDWDQLTALIAASSAGHLDIVKLLLKKGADVNASDKDSITALMEAAIMGQTDVVKELLKQEAEVDAEANSGVTALWLAAGEGKDSVVKELLKSGASATNKRSDGITALMAACVGGHGATVKLLSESGAEVGEKDNDGVTALMNAAEIGSSEIVKLLLKKGADAGAMSETGFTPLIVAAAGGHLESCQALVEAGADVNAMHPEGVNALMYAAAGGHLAVTEFLIKSGADVNMKHVQGGGAILEASTAGALDVVKALIAAGADPLIKDNDQVTPLMSAASQGHADVSQLLIEKGVEVNATSSSGGTALMFAAGGGHAEACQVLIKAGADVNATVAATKEYKEQVEASLASGKEDVEPHKDGVTALMVAAQGGHDEALKVLLEAGASVSATDEDGVSSLMTAVKGNFGDVALMLVEAGADPNEQYEDDTGVAHSLLFDSIAVQNEDFALLLIEKGAAITHQDKSGVTTLIQAAHGGLLKVVEALLSKGGVHVEASNEEGVTALIAAASQGQAEVVGALLAGGANIESKDKDGTNALMAAVAAGHLDTVKLLINGGANVNAQNVDGHTALMFAENGRTQVATLVDKYAEYLSSGEDDGESSNIMQEALAATMNIISELLSSGADKTLKDKDGHVAKDFAYDPEAAAAAGTEEL